MTKQTAKKVVEQVEKKVKQVNTKKVDAHDKAYSRQKVSVKMAQARFARVAAMSTNKNDFVKF